MSMKSVTNPRSGQSGRTGSQLLRDSAAQNIFSKNGGKTGHHSQTSNVGVTGLSAKGKNTAVISYDELERIRQQCSIGNLAQHDLAMRTRERMTLQDKSKARVQNWPNTIEALRRKRDEERIRRLEEEEIERRKVDALEYELTVQARLQAIDRANKAMHDSQDQVKAFHSRMLMCDTLQEREMQLQLRKRKQEVEKQIQAQWDEIERMKMEEHDEKMRQKLVEEYVKKMDNQRIINDQLHQFKMRMIKRIQDEMLEGKLIKQQVQEELERERQREVERKQKQQRMAEDIKFSNQEVIKYQEIQRLKELEEEQRIAQYAHKREHMDKLRKDKEQQRFDEKQATRQKMIDRQAEVLKGIKSKEEEILNKQVEEAEEKARLLFEEQERRRQQLKEAIERSRQQQIDRKVQERDQDHMEQREFTEFWKLRNEELTLAEMQEKAEERNRAEELKHFQRYQVEKKNYKREEEFKKDLEEATKAQALLDQNEKNFYSYAEQAIKEWQDSGKNVKPLILELKNYKKQIVL